MKPKVIVCRRKIDREVLQKMAQSIAELTHQWKQYTCQADADVFGLTCNDVYRIRKGKVPKKIPQDVLEKVRSNQAECMAVKATIDNLLSKWSRRYGIPKKKLKASLLKRTTNIEHS